MAYKPTSTLTTRVGEARTWTVDSEAVEILTQIAETLERIQQQLALITGMELEPGDST